MKKDFRGSMTVEAAILVPLFLFAMLTILSLMEMMHYYSRVQMELCQAGRKMALYLPAADLLSGEESPEENEITSIATTLIGEQYAKNYILNHLTDWEREESQLNLFRSQIMEEGDLIDVVVTYPLEPHFNFFFIPSYDMVNRCRMHAWTGYEVAGNSAETTGELMVYITETGTVFHLTTSCTYLDLSIRTVTMEEISDCRNYNGGIYHRCEICGDSIARTGEEYDVSAGTCYFITNYGDRYHTTLNCSGLRRTISEIPISQVGERRACSRCGGG